ncbi:hypothetical protein [Shimia abyssi]|uniref:Uncharacterized protein n=1 Tax=Shimia abyssi TaxID=1662395 RepID=A0A2P8FJZ2_9RHOB|nr:hypothetical protein [Shimia abyssi]PSL22043.1 hypothetical protein CLV88_101468 [Shimia abyssi]
MKVVTFGSGMVSEQSMARVLGYVTRYDQGQSREGLVMAQLGGEDVKEAELCEAQREWFYRGFVWPVYWSAAG